MANTDHTTVLQICGETNGRVVQVRVKGKCYTVREPLKDVFHVPQGLEFFIVAKGKRGRAVENFIVKPPNTRSLDDLQKEQPFCYRIQSAEKKHAGWYNWEARCNGHIQEVGKFEIVIVADPDDQGQDPENDETLLKQRVAMPIPAMQRLDPQGAVGRRPQVEVQPNQRETPYNLRQRPNTPGPGLPPIGNQLNGPTGVCGPRQHTPQLPAAYQTRQQTRTSANQASGGCTLPLDRWFNQCESYQQITHLVMLGDPTTHGESRCWMGLGLGAAHIARCDLENFEYHHRGSVGHGPMRKVLEIMKSNGQFMLDIVRYFSQHQNRRVDIMRHIQSFHGDCSACSAYYNL